MADEETPALLETEEELAETDDEPETLLEIAEDREALLETEEELKTDAEDETAVLEAMADDDEDEARPQFPKRGLHPVPQ